MSSVESFMQQLLATSIWEWLAVATGIVYVILAARRIMLCWIFAFISSSIYIYLCLSYQLYIETALQFFYVMMAVVGWYSWRKDSLLSVTTKSDVLDVVEAPIEEIKTWSLSKHGLNIVLSGMLAFLLGFMFDRYTDQANPYMDAFTTVFSLATTFMVTQKILENWIYWIIIDLVSIVLYYNRGLQLTAVLYGLFTILALAGFFAWYSKYQRQNV